MLMTKGLMDRALHHETALERVRDKARQAEEELFELKNWKVVTEKKLKLAEQARDENLYKFLTHGGSVLLRELV